MAVYDNIELDEHFRNFVKQEVNSGRYNSASEVVSEGLRLMEKEQRKRGKILTELIEAEKSGIAEDWTPENFYSRMQEKYGDL